MISNLLLLCVISATYYRLRGWGVLDRKYYEHAIGNGVTEDVAKKHVRKKYKFLYFVELFTSKGSCAAQLGLVFFLMLQNLGVNLRDSVIIGGSFGLGFLFQSIWEKGKGFMAVHGQDKTHEKGTKFAEFFANFYRNPPSTTKERKIWGIIYLGVIGALFSPFIVLPSYVAADVPFALTILAAILPATKGIVYWVAARVTIRYAIELAEIIYGIVCYGLTAYIVFGKYL